MTTFDAATFDISRNRLTGQAELRAAGRLVLRSTSYREVAQRASALGATAVQLTELREGYEQSVERC